ncbi:MAG TPA: response regulator transcription factor [Gryllotalpicola sp.]
MIRVLVVDDLPSARFGLRVLLDARDDIEVVGEAPTAIEALTAIAALTPDVVLMDVRMPGMDGIEATRLINASVTGRRVPVIVMSTFDEDAHVFDAIDAGAAGFVLKGASGDEFADAVRQAARGEGLLSKTVTKRVLDEFAQRAAAVNARRGDHAGLAQLTRRERDVILEVCRGMTDSEIAAELHIGVYTVKDHLVQIRRKIGVRNRTAIMGWAVQNGLYPGG